MSVISHPDSLRLLPCVEILEEAGFEVTQGWGGDLRLVSSTGVAALTSNTITADTNFWDRLGVSVGSGKSHVRKAYLKKSLEWHPDRWISHPRHSGKAQEVFQLVHEAYVGLSGCLKRETEGGEKCE